MANREKEDTLDNILPEREDSYESFYEAITSSVLEQEDNGENNYKGKVQSGNNRKRDKKD